MRFMPLSLLAVPAGSLLPARNPEKPLTGQSTAWGGEAGCITVAAAAKKVEVDDKNGRMRFYERLGRQPDYTLK